jgi:hypothetical protein
MENITPASKMREQKCSTPVLDEVWSYILKLKWNIQDTGVHWVDITPPSDEAINILTDNGYTIKSKKIDGVMHYRLSDEEPPPAPADDVLSLDKPWDWTELSINPSITLKDVLDHPDKPWCWPALSCNPSITLKDVLAHPDKPWNWYMLSRNPSIPLKDVLAHPDKPWDWGLLSFNPSITMKDVLDNPDKPWSWVALSRNPAITGKDVLAHPDKPWDWRELSVNTSVGFME